MGNGGERRRSGKGAAGERPGSSLPHTTEATVVMSLRWIWLVLAVVGIGMTVWGVRIGQMGEVKRHADFLCTDCIGLGGK